MISLRITSAPTKSPVRYRPDEVEPTRQAIGWGRVRAESQAGGSPGESVQIAIEPDVHKALAVARVLPDDHHLAIRTDRRDGIVVRVLPGRRHVIHASLSREAPDCSEPRHPRDSREDIDVIYVWIAVAIVNVCYHNDVSGRIRGIRPSCNPRFISTRTRQQRDEASGSGWVHKGPPAVRAHCVHDGVPQGSRGQIDDMNIPKSIGRHRPVKTRHSRLSILSDCQKSRRPRPAGVVGERGELLVRSHAPPRVEIRRDHRSARSDGTYGNVRLDLVPELRAGVYNRSCAQADVSVEDAGHRGARLIADVSQNRYVQWLREQPDTTVDGRDHHALNPLTALDVSSPIALHLCRPGGEGHWNRVAIIRFGGFQTGESWFIGDRNWVGQGGIQPVGEGLRPWVEAKDATDFPDGHRQKVRPVRGRQLLEIVGGIKRSRIEVELEASVVVEGDRSGPRRVTKSLAAGRLINANRSGSNSDRPARGP